MKRISITIVILLSLARLPGSEPARAASERNVAARVIRDSIAWALTKDRPLLESVMARDQRLFIFDPDSKITTGWQQFVKNFDFWMDPRFKATGLDIRDLRIEFSPLADAAWWSCILDDLYEWDGKAGAWKDTRWTGVMEKRDDTWRITQMHFSFAADRVAEQTKARLAAGPAADAAPAEASGFDPARWDLSQAKVEEHLGRQALTGTAFLKDVVLRNGVIEVDIATTNRTRSYPGVLFRVKDAANYERFYVRPHRSPFYDDVLQYGPTFNGVDSWQLYNGPGLSTAMEVLPDRWNRLKIVVAGAQAHVYWNDSPEPVLIVDELAHGAGTGGMGLAGPLDGTAFFSNLTFKADEDLGLPLPVPRISMPGLIADWELSEPFPAIGVDFTNYPGKIAAAGSWKPVAADRRGMVDVSRYFPRKSRAGDCVLARTTLPAESDSLLRVSFGYSDIVTIFLNGRPLYSGNSIYQSRDRSFLGIVGYQDELYLPLKKGDNELLLLLGETMGGWGFCCRRADAVFAHASLKKEWSVTEGLALPEAVAFDPGHECCYVSNYFNEGREFISKVSSAGAVIEREWIKGLRMPTGMRVKGNTLYAVDRNGLNVIDIKRREVTRTIPLPGLRMANDVAVDRAGNFYVSDTAGGTVFRHAAGKLEPWLKDLNRPNALLCEKKRLLVGQNETLVAVDLATRTVQELARFETGANIDGIEPDGRGGYLVGDHGGRLFRISPQGEKTLLLDTSTAGDKIADFAFLPQSGLLIIPTFDANSLAAYSWPSKEDR
jgi:ketosteroid isomerase-like protein